MGVLLLFLAAGCATGWGLRERTTFIGLTQRLTRYALWVLLCLMGAKLAQSRELFARDLTLLAWAAGSALLLGLVLTAIFALLRFLGVRGPERPAADSEAVQLPGGGALQSVALNAGCILLGALIALGLPPQAIGALPLGKGVEFLLFLLLFLIGCDLGAELHRLDLRHLALPILLAPFLNIALSLACGLAFAWFRGLPLREGMLLYAGLGWYSLAPVLIAGHGLVLLSAMAFIHNLFRELLAILTAPLAARLSPYLPIYLGGATTMDVMLPFVQRYAGRQYTLASFFSGLVCSLAVAPLVRLLLG